MKLRTLALGLGMALAMAAPASAQRGEPGRWELLGEERVGFGADHDVVRLNNDENFYRNKSYRRLRFVAAGGEVKMRSVRLVYLNGQSQNVDFNRTLAPGQEVDVDLGGERSYLRQIEMFYHAKFGVNLGGGGLRVNQPSIKVFAENVWRERRPEPPRPFAGRRDWLPLGEVSVGFRADRDVIRIGQSEEWFRNRGFDRLHFIAENNDVRLMSVRVVYFNGFGEDFPIDRNLDTGGADFTLDLPGGRSFIREIEIVSRKRPGNRGPALIKVLGETGSRWRR